MTIHIADQHTKWIKWGAAGIGLAAVLGEAFIATGTLLSGYWFGFYDVIGVALGILALVLVWKRPEMAVLFWLVEEVMLYNGHLLISIACLPMLLLPLSAAGLATWSWARSRTSPAG